MTPDYAIDVVARQVLANSIEKTDWDEYPDIGAHDWNAIVEAAKARAAQPELALFLEALSLLHAGHRNHRGDE